MLNIANHLHDDEITKSADEFIEWEEVYDNMLYGTLKSELNRIWSENKAVIFRN